MAVGYDYELYVDGARVFYSNSSFNIYCGVDQFADMSGEATGSYTYDEGQYAGWTTIQGSTTPEYAYEGQSPVSDVIRVTGKVYLYSIPAATITDLTNTKWLINSTTCTAGYGQFNVSYIANSQSYGGELRDMTILGIGYSFSPDGEVATADTIAYGASFYNMVVGDTIEFLSGTDVTNANLISWLTANATQIVETSGSMYLGTSNIANMYIGQNEVEKVYLGQDLVYEKQAPSGFSVSGKNYAIYTNCCYYSTDGGTTWIDASTIPTGQLNDFTITGITQFMVKCFENSNNEYGSMVWDNVSISGLDRSSSNPAVYDFGTLTADITGMELWSSLD